MNILSVFKKKVPEATGKVEINKGKFNKEHKNLVKVLKSGSRKEQVEEAIKQKKELR